jgi:hypothetical protein
MIGGLKMRFNFVQALPKKKKEKKRKKSQKWKLG